MKQDGWKLMKREKHDADKLVAANRDLEGLLMYGKSRIQPKEEEIGQAIRMAKENFVQEESSQRLSYPEFLLVQARMVRKRWWLLQAMLLVLMGRFLMTETDSFYLRRGLGVYATLFAILLLPELWKNLSYNCLEIEAASFYSLRQVYAARILLFGMADVLILSVFSGIACGSMGVSFSELAIQFLVPLVLTAGICFAVFGLQHRNILTAVFPCILWGAVWSAIISNEHFYNSILHPLWAGILAISLVFLFATLWHLWKKCGSGVERRVRHGFVSA